MKLKFITLTAFLYLISLGFNSLNSQPSIGEMQAKLLKKIEELTLYVIELKKENNELNNRINQIENK